MKKYLYILSMIIVVTLCVAFVSDIAYAASPSVDEIKVFSGYEETDDWLIVAVYNISGTNTSTSSCGLTYPWVAQLVYNPTGAVIGNWTISQCGMRPIGLYISASQAATLTWADNYSVKILAQWGSPPSASKNLVYADWKGSDLLVLDTWVRQQASIIQTFDGATYLEAVAYPTYDLCLNADGGYIFDKGISYLSSYRPNLFITTLETYPIEYEPSVVGDTYAEDLWNNWDTVLGTELAPALTDAGYYFGIDGRWMGAILALLGFIAIAMIEKTFAMLIIIGGILVGVFPMWIVMVLSLLAVVVLVRSLFWSST